MEINRDFWMHFSQKGLTKIFNKSNVMNKAIQLWDESEEQKPKIKS